MKNSYLRNILLLSSFLILIIPTSHAEEDHILNGHLAIKKLMLEHELQQQKIKAYQAEKDYRNQQSAQEALLRSRASSQQNKRIQAPNQKQINELADNISSDKAKNAVNYLDNLKPDPYEKRKLDPVNMDGFDKELKPQQSNFKYSFER